MAFGTIQAAEAKTVKRGAATRPPISRHAATPAEPAGMVRLVATPKDESDRWTLQPIVGDYDRSDPYGFRLRLRGAKMKMRVPLDFN